MRPYFSGLYPKLECFFIMNIGCVVKGILAAAALALAGFYVTPLLGLDATVPMGSLVAVGLFVGYLVSALVNWMSCSSCESGSADANVLYVGNIPFKAREDEVKRLFEAYGAVKSVRLVRGGPSRRPKGYGFVEMATTNDMKAALALNDTDFAGRKLRVNEAKDKKED